MWKNNTTTPIVAAIYNFMPKFTCLSGLEILN